MGFGKKRRHLAVYYRVLVCIKAAEEKLHFNLLLISSCQLVDSRPSRKNRSVPGVNISESFSNCRAGSSRSSLPLTACYCLIYRLLRCIPHQFPYADCPFQIANDSHGLCEVFNHAASLAQFDDRYRSILSRKIGQTQKRPDWRRAFCETISERNPMVPLGVCSCNFRVRGRWNGFELWKMQGMKRISA